MEFSRIGKHTVKCVITEQEILDLGYSLDDIMSNGQKTQEFMNHIFDLAEQKFQMNFEMGVKTVRADFLPNHTVVFTFSEKVNDTAIAERLKSIVGSLLESIAPGNKQQENSTSDENIKNFKMPEGVKIEVMFLFDDIEILSRFSKLVTLEKLGYNALYKFEDTYFLLMDLSGCTDEDVKRLSMLVDEYATDIVVGAEKLAFIEEHGEPILKKEALQNLKLL